MKNLLILSAMLLFGITTFSQNNIYLKINHNLGSSSFAFNSNQVNDLGDNLNVTRLQYYITPYSITHDGGTVTLLNKTILVDAGLPTYDLLGNYVITTIEKITFAIGVDSLLNHLDPSLASGALAPKSPSMHWGWAPGYRFIAYEGKAGTSVPPTQVYELHALGDHNFHYITITTAGTTDTNGKVIELNADYLKGLNGINVASGLLEHGETVNTSLLIDNFKNLVFTSIEGNPTVGVDIKNRSTFRLSIYPNPVIEGSSVIFTTSEVLENSQIIITDIQGKQIYKNILTSEKTEVENISAGTYVVSVYQGVKYITSSKLIVANN
ncbi:T9SS type A sorting domain-containing protein [Flavobacteriales bacterium]|nr:T9SS type A sorting domain-containing protein [Flavobacteriales bacterium]